MLISNHHLRQLWFGVLLLVTATISHAQSSNPSLSAAIDEALTARCLDSDQTAVSVVALPSGQVLYTHNADTPLLPASALKLVTTAAALHYLGPEYRFSTDVLYSGQRSGDKLQGDVILRGGGDPKLTPADLWHIATRVKNSGISEINGRLIADARFFDEVDHAPGWADEEGSQRAYNAKVGALSLNYNIVTVHVRPGLNVGDPLLVALEPSPAYITVTNNGKTIGKGKSFLSASRSDQTTDGTMNVLVNGKLHVDAGDREIYRNVDNPTRYTIEAFRTILQQVGVKVPDTTEIGATPAGATLIYRHESVPLSLILKELNLYSNNFIAEQVLKTIAAKMTGLPGSHAGGSQLVGNFLNAIGIDTRGLNITDGSGLSKENRITTQMLTSLLAIMHKRFDIGPDFAAVLRIMGAEGAHSRRLSNSPAMGRIRAKTGTLSGVSTLAGYVATADDRVFAFAFFLNNNRCGHSGADAVEDRIVNAIYQLGNTEAPLQAHLRPSTTTE